MGLLASAELLVQPDHRMFGVADPAAFGEDAPVPGSDWLAVGEGCVRIGVVTDLADSSLRLEMWDGEPPPAPDDCELEATARVFLPTGRLGIDQITIGWVHDVLIVPPGVYNVRVTGQGQEQVQRAYEEVDFNAPDRDERLDALAGQERYLVQFWLDTATAGLVHSAGLVIHPGHDVIGIADRGVLKTAAVPSLDGGWLATGPSIALIKLSGGRPRRVMDAELWDGRPPPVQGDHDGQALITLHLPSGEFAVAGLRAGAEHLVRDAMSGPIDIPAGTYNVLITRRRGGCLAQFWPKSPA